MLAELIATWALSGAYPYLNLFVADETLGVRLVPNSSTAVVSPHGRITDIEVHGLGFRGPVFGESADRVLIVGDSQVMAYGVEEGEGFPSRLAARGFNVLAAGIPTWGPHEYTLVADELIAGFQPAVVVVVLNAANDFHEADTPNIHRTSARDGWAIGRTPGGVLDTPTDFPGRHFLLSRSHLVLAARLLLHGDPHEREVPPALTFAAYAQGARATPPWRSPLGPHLNTLARTCLLRRCRLVTAFLPADVQVDPSAWGKYGAFIAEGPPDLAATFALNRAARVDEAVTSERSARLRHEPVRTTWLDLGTGLGFEGAFLPDDFHLSPKGHAAVADQLAEFLPQWLTLSRPFSPAESP